MASEPDDELLVRFRDAVSGSSTLGRVLSAFFALFWLCLSLVALALIYQWVVEVLVLVGVGSPPAGREEPTSAGVLAAVGVFALPTACLIGWLLPKIAVIQWRTLRGTWWLRLTRTGFDVNIRVGRPHRYRWDEIESFLLVTTAADPEQAVLTPGKTIGDAVQDLDGAPPLIVGFRYSPLRRRSLGVKLLRLLGKLRSPDGTIADEVLMGWWDRPFDDAVDLMNQWLTRYRTG